MQFAAIWAFLVALLKGPKDDMKIIPHTAASAALLWVAMWGIVILGWFVVIPTVALAQAASKDAQALGATMQELKATLLVERWERQLREMEARIFTLEIDIDAQVRRRATVPVPMQQQLRELRSSRDALQRKLDQYMAENMKLLEPQ